MRRRALIAIATLTALLAVLVATSISTAAPAGTKVADLYASKTTDVGDVYAWNDQTNLYVEIDLTGGWCMTESHVAVASDLSGIPQVNGNPPPGQFPQGATYSQCSTTAMFSFALSEFDTTPVIAVHAKVWDPASATTVNLVSDTATSVTSFMGVAQAPAAAMPAYEPVGYMDCGQYQLSPATGSVWDTQNGGSASNDTGGPFAGATWIWPTSNPVYPDSGEFATFERTFNLPGPPTTGSILVTADNGYRASLNGNVLGTARLYDPFFATGDLTEAGVNTTGWQVPDSWNLTPLQMGANTLSIIAANEAAYPDYPTIQTTGTGGVAGGVCPNPGGLIFKAQASYLAKSASAWGDTAPMTHNFPGKNWATYIPFTTSYDTVQTTCPTDAGTYYKNFNLTLPPGSTCIVPSTVTVYGDMSMTGGGNLRIRGVLNGDMTENSTGSLVVEGTGTVTGDITESGAGNIRIDDTANVTGDVTENGDGGIFGFGVPMTTVNGNIVENDNGDVTITNMTVNGGTITQNDAGAKTLTNVIFNP